jgi:hypothetical protein
MKILRWRIHLQILALRFLDFVVNDSNTQKMPEKEAHIKIMQISELAEKKLGQKMQTTA